MSDHDAKLERVVGLEGDRPKATELEISRMSGVATVPDDGRDGRGRALLIVRRPIQRDGKLGEAEVWRRIDKDLFQRD